MTEVAVAVSVSVAVALRHYVVTKFIMETEATSLAAYQQFGYLLLVFTTPVPLFANTIASGYTRLGLEERERQRGRKKIMEKSALTEKRIQTRINR